jgi:hypothetical protein
VHRENDAKQHYINRHYFLFAPPKFGQKIAAAMLRVLDFCDKNAGWQRL